VSCGWEKALREGVDLPIAVAPEFFGLYNLPLTGLKFRGKGERIRFSRFNPSAPLMPATRLLIFPKWCEYGEGRKDLKTKDLKTQYLKIKKRGSEGLKSLEDLFLCQIFIRVND
jgi:hypothetical protein